MSEYAELLAALQAEQDIITLTGNHRYRDFKTWRPGVTTVIKVKDAPRLDDWKVEVQVQGTARAAHANPPLFGESEEAYVARLVKLADEYEHRRITDAAADIGHQVHKLVEHAIKELLGTPIPAPEVTDEARYVFAGWSGWAKAMDFRPLVAEARVVNRTDDYCGTLDCLALAQGRLTVVDWKPKPVLYPERRLQLSAYAEALRSMGWPLVDRAVVSMPRDGGDIKIVPLEDDHATTYGAFLHCLGLYRWDAIIRNGGKQKAA